MRHAVVVAGCLLACAAQAAQAAQVTDPVQVTGGAVVLGMGVPPKPDFWLHQGTPQQPRVHMAFRADNRTIVDAFYKAAIAAGGKDNGPPGLRPHYHANYYGAFVLDPDGHNIEACCHDPA